MQIDTLKGLKSMFKDTSNKESQIQTELNLGLMKDKKDSLYESMRETEGCHDNKN